MKISSFSKAAMSNLRWAKNLESVKSRLERLAINFSPLGCRYCIYSESTVGSSGEFGEIYQSFDEPETLTKSYVFPFELCSDESKTEAIFPFWSESLKFNGIGTISKEEAPKLFYQAFKGEYQTITAELLELLFDSEENARSLLGYDGPLVGLHAQSQCLWILILFRLATLRIDDSRLRLFEYNGDLIFIHHFDSSWILDDKPIDRMKGGESVSVRIRRYDYTEGRYIGSLNNIEYENPFRELSRFAPDTEKGIPLHRAAQDGNLIDLEMLLKAGANINAEDWLLGSSPLLLAVEEHRAPVVDFLLRSGADVNAKNHNGNAPLFRAARNGDLEIVRLLIEAGANVNVLDPTGWTPLHTASVGGYVEIVDLLIRADAILEMRNQYGWTALFLAAGVGRTEVVKKLLKAGADIRAKDAAGTTPLKNAQKNGHQEVAVILQQAEGKLPKDFQLDHSASDRWQELFWNYPAATEPYTVEMWQEILDGLIDSLNRQLQLRFIHAEPPQLYPNENDLSLGIRVTCSVPSPLGALNLYGIGGIEVYETKDEQLGISAHISLFVFLGDARLKAESPKNTDWTDDYIGFHFAKNDNGESKWECLG